MSSDSRTPATGQPSALPAPDTQTKEERFCFELLQKLDVILWKTDVQDLRFWFVSERAEVLLKYPVEQWKAERDFLAQHLHAEDREAVLDLLRRSAADGQSRRCEHRMLAADGSTLWFRTEVYPSSGGENSSVQMLHGLMVNITEQREAQTSFRLFLEAAPDAVVIIDRAGKILMVNSLTEKMFGYSRDELLGQSVEMLVPERYRHTHISQRERYSEEPRTRPMGAGQALWGLRKDGKEFPVEISLSPLETEQGTLVTSIIRDITQRKEGEVKFRGLLESAPDGIVVVDTSGKIVIVNTQVEKMFGYPREELLGQRVEVLVPERFQKGHIGQREGYVADPKTRPMGAGRALTGRRKDGQEFPVEISLSPLETGQGMLITSIIRDITDRRRVEEQIQASLREKDVLLKEIHHRVKNNLQVTSSLLKLQSGCIEDQPTKDLFEESQNRIRSMALVHEKLYQSSDLSRINFSEYVKSLAELLFRSFGVDASRIHFEVEGGGVFLTVEIAVPCGLIVNELLSNCLKHAFPDGRTGKIHVFVRRASRNLLSLQVADNGVGLPAEVNVEKTETLGLQLVRGLARQLGGTVTLNRAGGTSLEITFADSKTP